MSEVEQKFWQKPIVKLGFWALVGAIVGYNFGAEIARAIGRGAPELDLSYLVAGCIAMIYLFMGLLVGIGAALPRYGVKFLNTFDEDELRDDGRKLLASAGACICFGLALLVLVLGGTGPLSAVQSALAFFGLMIAALAFYWPMMRAMDELDRDMSHEAVSYTYYALLLIGGSWAALGHLGLAEGPAMLDWLSMFWGLMLVATFIAAGRRGLLNKG